MQIFPNNSKQHLEELTQRYWHPNRNKSTRAEKEMEVFFHEATQPISGDILHQWQNIVSAGQSAGMSGRSANTSFHPEETKAKKARLPFSPQKNVLQFVQTWRICFCNDQGPALTRSIHLVDKNKKQLARDCTEVGTQTKSIYGAFC